MLLKLVHLLNLVQFALKPLNVSKLLQGNQKQFQVYLTKKKKKIFWTLQFVVTLNNVMFMPSNNQNKQLNSKGEIQTSFKSFFYKRIFRKQNIFFTISVAYQCDPKHHRNIIEIHFEHLRGLCPF